MSETHAEFEKRAKAYLTARDKAVAAVKAALADGYDRVGARQALGMTGTQFEDALASGAYRLQND